jgi:hypothetical protein
MVQQTLIQAKDYLDHPIDTGCEIATEYLEKQSLCVECPFELCIKDIKYSTRVLLQSSSTIKQVFEAYNQGLTIEKVSKIFNNTTLSTIQYWIKHRHRIQKLLNKYSWAVQYI